MSEIRYDYLSDDYVIIAPERLHRPNIKGQISKGVCPFCPGNEDMTPNEIFSLRDEKTSNWKTRVIPNLYKAVKIEAPLKFEQNTPYETREGFGAHEIIIDTPRHLLRMDSWKLQEYINWLLTLKFRLEDLKRDIRLVEFILFKNQGSLAGATQEHPHSQLIALPFVSKTLLNRIDRAKKYYEQYNKNLFLDIAKKEEISSRLISQSDNFIAFCPYASNFAFEVNILAKQEGLTSLIDLDKFHIQELASILDIVIKALYKQLGDFDFNIVFNTPPLQLNAQTKSFFNDIGSFWAFNIKITPRVYTQGGFEIESKMGINPLTPEESAHLLRGSIESKSLS